jgi:hypothetical protein
LIFRPSLSLSFGTGGGRLARVVETGLGGHLAGKDGLRPIFSICEDNVGTSSVKAKIQNLIITLRGPWLLASIHRIGRRRAN